MEKDLIRNFNIVKVKEDKSFFVDDEVIVENELKIFVNNDFVTRLLCSPKDLENLIIGYLFTLSYIKNTDDIKSININENKADVFLNDSLSDKTQYEIRKIKIDRNKLFELSSIFQNKSEVFKRTGGAHSVGLIKDFQIINFVEDVSRSNAVDKLIGYILKERIDISDKFIFTSCRVSEQIIEKVKKIGFSLLVSQSSPTSRAVDISRKNNINLIGFARGERFNIYNRNENLIVE